MQITIDQKIKEASDTYEKLYREKKNLTKDIDVKITEAQRSLTTLKKQKMELIKSRRSGKKSGKRTVNTMNLVFTWADGTCHKTADRMSMYDFCDLVHAKGLPISYEIRG